MESESVCKRTVLGPKCIAVVRKPSGCAAVVRKLSGCAVVFENVFGHKSFVKAKFGVAKFCLR